MTREERYKFIAKEIHFADWFMYFHLSFGEELHQALKEAEEIITTLSEDLHREKEQAYMQGYEDARKKNKGEWITDETSGSALNARYYCSNCGKELKMPYTVIKAEQKNGKYLFCDRCGADMRGDE